jgi:ABC-2 type transport system permease protein
MTAKKIKQQNFIQLFAIIFGIIALNILAQFYFGRFDLTTEKRFSVSTTTKDIVTDLDDFIYFKVYLDGDLPTNFELLKNSTRELLDEFRAYNKNVMYEFINPSENDNKKERFKFYRELAKEGLAYYNVPVETNDGFAQKTVFPSILLTYKDKNIPINLLVSSKKVPSDADINNSIQNLELNLVNAIRKVSKQKIPQVVFTTGHGELDSYATGDLAYELSKTYDVGQIALNNKLSSLMRRVMIDSNSSKMIPLYDLIIIAKPQTPFTTKEIFLLDQYIMHGGKVVWALDMVKANMDSLRYSTSTLGMPIDINLNELLFKYGARINSNLVLNRNAMEIGTAEGTLKRWDFFPLALPVKGHIITKNLTAVATRFVSTIDIVGSKDIKKTVLLKTDKRSRIMPAPALIDLMDIIYRGPNPALYNQSGQNIALLMEGSFHSVFENRVLDPRIMANSQLFDIKYNSENTSQLVLSDGNILENQVMETANGKVPYPLGYDRYSKKMFDNRKFMLNAINYMLGDNALIKLRNKQYKIRLLDKAKISNERLKYQIINTVLPIGTIILLGLIIGIVRKRKYGIKK